MFKCIKCEGEDVNVQFCELDFQLNIKDIAKINKYNGYINEKGIVIKEFLLCTCRRCGYTYISDVAKEGTSNPFNLDEKEIKKAVEDLSNSIKKDFKKLALNAADEIDKLNIKYRDLLKDL